MIAGAVVPFDAHWLWMGFFLCLSVLSALCWEELGREHCFQRNGWAVLALTAGCVLLAFLSFLNTPEFSAWGGL